MYNLTDYVDKRIYPQFHKEKLTMDLSHALFSSNKIDTGSMLLLKSIPNNINYDLLENILDAGSGTGVLGIALGKKAPKGIIHFQDRDALSVAFSKHNCLLNDISKCKYYHSLLLENLDNQKFDLILSNLPAKAGKPVLEYFLLNAPSHLTEKGTCAVVIVSTLSLFTEKVLRKAGYHIHFSESSKNHRIFHFSNNNANKNNKMSCSLDPYIRSEHKFRVKNLHYNLKTVHGLPNFDSLGYGIKLLAALLCSQKISKDILIWNPTQGHIPVISSLINKNISLTITGRDALSLDISQKNISRYGIKPVILKNIPAFETIPREIGYFDTVIAQIESVPEVKWQKPFMEKVRKLLNQEGNLFLAGRSVDIARILKYCAGLSLDKSIKEKGFRSVILTKNKEQHGVIT